MRASKAILKLETLEGRCVQSVSPISGYGAGVPSSPHPPALSSLPGAAKTLYLDFNGHLQDRFGFHTDIATPAFDFDGDTANLSEDEIDIITLAWRTVAEDFAPFNINVTTVEPDDFSNDVALRIVIGGSSLDWYRDVQDLSFDMSPDIYGVSLHNSFSNVYTNTAYVFSEDLLVYEMIGNVASHEAGHAFGLEHQGEFREDGSFREYGQGTELKAPIMGNALAERVTWTVGPTSGIFHPIQDDFQMLQEKFGLRPDDVGNTFATARAVSVPNSSHITPVEETYTVAGMVGRLSDEDVYSFVTSGGQVDVRVSVPYFVGNLNPRVSLHRENGTTVAATDINDASPTSIWDLDYRAKLDLPAGKYFVKVGSFGEAGDLGTYELKITALSLPASKQPQLERVGPDLADGKIIDLLRPEFHFDLDDFLRFPIVGRSLSGKNDLAYAPIQSALASGKPVDWRAVQTAMEESLLEVLANALAGSKDSRVLTR